MLFGLVEKQLEARLMKMFGNLTPHRSCAHECVRRKDDGNALGCTVYDAMTMTRSEV